MIGHYLPAIRMEGCCVAAYWPIFIQTISTKSQWGFRLLDAHLVGIRGFNIIATSHWSLVTLKAVTPEGSVCMKSPSISKQINSGREMFSFFFYF